MSKKSRKRNKKILAAIGIGLGAAALASRKPKQSSTEASSGRDGDITLHFNRESIPTKKDYVNESGSARAPVQPSTKCGSKRKAAVVSIDNHGDDSDKNAKTKSVTQIKKKK